ncbi:MAG: amidohydrolase family protein [Verrucomicrobia bacterium]|nr:amidohydrolase family protein [Verrucomicrobiota bacterium]MBI3869250.1 amidohydrolase family protein [Verrucomicrobiota bacterium]
MTSVNIDAHVHWAGNGSSGGGSWIRLSGPHRFLARFMLHQIQMPGDALSGDFDRIYTDRLLAWIRESSVRRVVLLAHDEVYHSDGRRMEGVGSFYVPNDEVLTRARAHPEFLPAVSIHPARADALDELERCAEAGAVMMKCLPNCHNIDCNDPRYRKFWERMAALRLPLLAHTGGEHTVPVVRAEFSDPRILRLPLECGVTVIAAHCATRSGWSDPDYFPHFVEMLQRYPRLYGDTSAFNLPARGAHARECLRPGIQERLIHGSDFPVPIQGLWAWARGIISFRDYWRCRGIRNAIERDFQLKKAMGFDAAHFTRVGSLLRVGTA